MKIKLTYLYVRKLVALPFLPEDEIRQMFEQLRAQAVTDQLKQFTTTWQKPGSTALLGRPLAGAFSR